MNKVSINLKKAWEQKSHFSMGVITQGPLLHTAGITARDANGALVGAGDICAQTEQCFSILGEILESAQADWSDVVKFTIFTTDIDLFDRETMLIRKPFFVDRPAATLVEVSRLINPEMMVEIEAIIALPASPKTSG